MDSNPPPAIPVYPATTEDKTVAIIGYVTLIGFIVAIILHGSKKTQLGSYHLRQSFGLMLASFVLMFGGFIVAAIPFIGWLIFLAIWAGLIVAWIMGLVAAASGQLKPLPLLGKQFESWFSGMFN